MNNYELAAVLKVEADDASQKSAIEKVKGFVTSNGGNITEATEAGKKDLAYEINSAKEGFYVYFTFEAPAASIKSIDSICRIEESLLCHMIIKK